MLRRHTGYPVTPSAQDCSAVIFAPAGTSLSSEEKQFFQNSNPCGFILFERHCVNPKQLRQLIGQLRQCCADGDPWILVDQEGGSVTRLKPPHWRHPPSLPQLVSLGENARRAVLLNHALIADDLNSVGINVNCAPVLDLAIGGFLHQRSFSRDPQIVADLGQEACNGLLGRRVLPVIKHTPGHGRAKSDSHYTLPRVTTSLDILRDSDFLPFHALRHMPCAMTAHVAFDAIDPGTAATLSHRVIHDIIRDIIGFQGLLISDDIDMKALQGPLDERAAKALAAGCDLVLQCNGKLEDMRQTMKGVRPLDDSGQARMQACRLSLTAKKYSSFDHAEACSEMQSLLRPIS